MYNRRMPNPTYEIRTCNSCGLRYPLPAEHAFGTRCPICMGDTRLSLSRNLTHEPKPERPVAYQHQQYAFLLDNIRSAWNVGSIFRTADGLGFGHAYLCGITPTPDNEAVTKTALGAEDSVSWSYHKDAVRLAKGLKKEGWRILGLEETEQAQDLTDFHPSASEVNTLLIAGNEISGIDPGLLELCEAVYCIPMRGGKKSLNVAIAFSIAAWTIATTNA
jgi:23S rRNA (guanosine2251-2'-O)-methyltransferase